MPVRLVGLLLAALALWQGYVAAQSNFNEREVRAPQPTSGDKGEVFNLDFRFKDPRIIKVNVRGQGTRIYWYLWYQVINRGDQAVKFYPQFELVTTDFPALYYDRIYDEAVEQAIIRYEDPTGYQEIKNSVSISSQPIPVSKPDAFPKAVTGVAIWEASTGDFKRPDGIAKDLQDTSRFSIFVKGLSNAFVQVDPLIAGQEPLTRWKTLQLNFRRNGDRTSLDSRNISFDAPAQWLYRAGSNKIIEKK